MKIKTIAASVALMMSVGAAHATPTSFVDIGNIGGAGTFVFDTIGSIYTAGGDSFSDGINVDTELGLWDEAGNLLDSNDDGIAFGGASQVAATLADGIYFLGISEFSTFFGNGFVNTGTAFESGDVANLVLNVNGSLGAMFADASDALDQETAFFRVSVGDVAAVPLPAGLPLMLAGMGALAIARRRQKAS